MFTIANRTRTAHLEIDRLRFVGEQLGLAVAKSLLEEENSRLLEETLEVKRALETRKVVERAKGILQRKLGLSEEEAYLRLRDQSRNLHKPMKDLADAIILLEEPGPPGKRPVRRLTPGDLAGSQSPLPAMGGDGYAW